MVLRLYLLVGGFGSSREYKKQSLAGRLARSCSPKNRTSTICAFTDIALAGHNGNPFSLAQMIKCGRSHTSVNQLSAIVLAFK